MQKLILCEGLVNDNLLEHAPLAALVNDGYEVVSVDGFTSIDNRQMCYALLNKPAHVDVPSIEVKPSDPLTVVLDCDTTGATVYYTDDGTEPTSASTEYTDAIEITETTTIKAIAVKGEISSEVVSATITIE